MNPARSAILLLSMTVLLAGCQGTSNRTAVPQKILPSFVSERIEKQREPNPPERMAIIWTDAVYTHPGKPATRGFGGRIYFYDKENNPVQVDGELMVFGYDDSRNRASDMDVPQRKFIFKPEQLAKHYSETELGPSYSVWVPWDAVGGQQKNISLFPVLKATNGQIVKGDYTRNVLPGKTEQYSTSDANADGLASRSSAAATTRSVTFRRPTGESVPTYPHSATNSPDDSSDQYRLKTTTIPLSPNLGRQLRTPRDDRFSESRRSQIPGAGAASASLAQNLPQAGTYVTYGEPTFNAYSGDRNHRTASRTEPRQSQTFGAPGVFPGQRTAATKEDEPATQLRGTADRSKQRSTRYVHPRSRVQVEPSERQGL